MQILSTITAILFATTAFATPLDVQKRAVSVSASTTCSYTSIKPSPAPLICGTEGDIHRVNTTILTWEAGSDSNKCLSYCKATSACVSYSWNSTSNVCMYFDASIKSSNFTTTGKTGTWFWNKRCFGQGCSTTKVTSTISKSSTAAKTSTVKTTTTSSVKSTSTTSAKTTSTTSAKTTSTKTSTSVKTTSTSTKSTSTKTTSTKTTSSTTKTTTPSSTCSAINLSVSNCNNITLSLTSLASVTFSAYFTSTNTIEAPLTNSATSTISGASSICDAAKTCAAQAAAMGLANLYASFDLYYLMDKCEFECVLNVLPNLNVGVFNTTDTDVGASVGFSAQVKVLGL